VLAALAVSRKAWIDWGWLRDNVGDLRRPLQEHVVLTALTMAVGLAIAFPVALVARRHRRLYGPVLGVAGLLYTIPALALFALLIPYTGLSRTTALIPLVSYTLLILVRNIVIGLDGIPPAVGEAATAMGYSSAARLWRVELPLALPTILAGIRLAAVSTIALVTVAGIIGFENLGGYMIIDGFQRDFRTPITVGALATVALAVVADRVLVAVGALLSPWRRRAPLGEVVVSGADADAFAAVRGNREGEGR
jgi:osmoprotectant transport system permease protein